MNPGLSYIYARLSEPSTWRGIIALVTAAGVALSPDQVDKIVARLHRFRRRRRSRFTCRASQRILQTFPIQGQPQQSFPIQGQPKQDFPIQGQPKQDFPVPGVPKQDLPAPGTALDLDLNPLVSPR
jgi:hypothetical protein